MYLLPQLIGSFATAHPRAQVDLEVANTGAIEAALVARTLDLGFIEGPSHHAEIEALPWRDDELAVFVRSDDPLARQRRPALATLVRARWVMREPGSGTREVFEAALRRHDLQVGETVTMGHSEAVKAGVRAGLGIGCLSTLALQTELAARQLVRVHVPGLDLRRRLWRVSRRGGYTSALQHAFEQHAATGGTARRRVTAR
jgi:DNA-binding transcriptional LysR family regulator